MFLSTRLLGLVEIIVSLLAIAEYIFLFYLLTRTRLLHTAFRTTSRIYSISVIFYMLFRIIGVVESQTLLLTSIYPAATYVIYRIMLIFSYSFWLGLSFITLERAIASNLVSSYEDRFNSVPVQLLILAIFVAVDIVQNVLRALYPMPTMIVVCFINTFVNLAVMYFIKRVNKARTSLEKDLSYRYQVKENVLITAFLPPTYALGLLRSAAFGRVMISLGIMVKKERRVSITIQYEQTRSQQDELWRVEKIH